MLGLTLAEVEELAQHAFAASFDQYLRYDPQRRPMSPNPPHEPARLWATVSEEQRVMFRHQVRGTVAALERVLARRAGA